MFFAHPEGYPKPMSNAHIRDFLDHVEELTKAIKDVETPDVARVRAKVKIAVAAAKSALRDGAAQVRGQAKQLSETTDDYVRENPWQVVGVAAVVGLVLGIMMTRRSD